MYSYEERIRAVKIQSAPTLSISASWKPKRLWWAWSISLVAPLRVRKVKGLADVAHLAKRLLKQETSLETEFPGY